MSRAKFETPNVPGNWIKYAVIFFILLMFLIILSSSTFVTIPPGQKGVEFKKFSGGLVKEKIYDQGFHVIMPWNSLIVYDVRTKDAYEEMEVLSKNGLTITVELSFRYSADPKKIGYLHDEIGKDYLETILKPEVRSATREVIGKYLPEELYSTKREAIQDEIYIATSEEARKKNIIIDAVLIREVKLPATLKDAIEQKLEEEQLSFQYEFRLDRERKEAERKIIEAQAKADANRILNQSLSENLLRDKGIEATLQLAESENTKVVIVGGGGDGLPLILNN